MTQLHVEPARSPAVQPYHPRPIRFRKLYEARGFRLKLYGISAKHEAPPASFCARAEAKLASILPSTTEGTYGVGFAMFHEGLDGEYLIVDWWIPGFMLAQRVYKVAADGSFEDFADTGIVACVWEIAVLSHEREAYVEHVLSRADRPDFEAYLNHTLDADL